MNRGRKVLVGVVSVVSAVGLTVGAAMAFSGSLPAHANVHALTLAFDSAKPVATSDDGTSLDPLGPGMTPAQDTSNIGSSSASIDASGSLNLDVQNAYGGYVTTVQANPKTSTAPLSIQSASLVADVGSPPIPAGVVALLGSTSCGKTLASTSPIQIAVEFPANFPADGAQYSAKLVIALVPTPQYAQAACPSF